MTLDDLLFHLNSIRKHSGNVEVVIDYDYKRLDSIDYAPPSTDDDGQQHDAVLFLVSA